MDFFHTVRGLDCVVTVSSWMGRDPDVGIFSCYPEEMTVTRLDTNEVLELTEKEHEEVAQIASENHDDWQDDMTNDWD